MNRKKLQNIFSKLSNTANALFYDGFSFTVYTQHPYKIPRAIHDTPTRIINGQFIPAGSPTDKFTQIRPGVSVGPEGKNNYGTTGPIVYRNDVPYVLTCYHVAMGTGVTPEYALQPAYYDGGIATTDRIGLIQDTQLNTRGDAALIDLDIPYSTSVFPTNEIITSARAPEIGEMVEKAGRTTGVTRGLVTGLGIASLDYSAYGYGAIAMEGFTVEPVSNPAEVIGNTGDSGALVYLPSQGIGVGLLTATYSTSFFASYLSYVLSDLNCSLAATSDEESSWSEIIGTPIHPWLTVGDEMLLDFTLTPSETLYHCYLFTQNTYADMEILWGKRSTESEYKLIGRHSLNPTCFLGDIPSGQSTVINLKLRPSLSMTLLGEYSLPIYIGHGATFVGGIIE